MFKSRPRCVTLILLFAGGISRAQVVSPTEINDPELRSLQVQKRWRRNSRQLEQSDPDESKRLQSIFEALQAQKQIMDRAQTLGNFALASAAAHDWPDAISQLKEGIQVCVGCSVLGQLHKDLGLICLHSGDTKDGLRELLEAKKLSPPMQI